MGSVTGIIVVATTIFAWGSANACGNSVQIEVDEHTKSVSNAEALVRKGEALKGYRIARKAIRALKREMDDALDVENPDEVNRLSKRAWRLLAIAQVRAKGTIKPSGRAYKRVKKRVQNRNMRWAMVKLAQAVKRAAKDPLLLSRHAEAQAFFKKHHKKALATLEKLAKSDLIPDAWAQATLATLSHEAGKTAQRDAALKKCKVQAGKNAQKICPTFDAPASDKPVS